MSFAGRRKAWVYQGLAVAGLLFGGISPVIGVASDVVEPSWQELRLHAPTQAQLEREKKGRVFIYDGLEYNAVEAAMDQHFDRIQNMMFTRIHHLPSGAGAAAEAEVENDGCD